MSKQQQHDRYLDYLLSLGKKMRLFEWKFKVSAEPCEEGALASIRIIRGQKNAVVHLCPFFDKLSREDQRQTLVHELVHCHMASASDPLGSTLGRHARELFVYQLEVGVEGLANVIAPHMPLPPKPKRK